MLCTIRPNGVTLGLTAKETYAWAHRPGAAWPGSELSGKFLKAEFDANGLVDYEVAGETWEDLDVNEFNACVADHLRDRLPKDHPCWFVLVGQFEKEAEHYEREAREAAESEAGWDSTP